MNFLTWIGLQFQLLWLRTQPQLQPIINQIRPVATAYFTTLILLAAGAILLPAIILGVGIAQDSTFWVSLAGIWWAACTLFLWAIASPLALVIEALTGGTSGSGRRYVNLVLTILLFELGFTLFAAAVPIENNWKSIPVFVITAALLIFVLNRRTMPARKSALWILVLMLGWYMLTFYFPNNSEKIRQKVASIESKKDTEPEKRISFTNAVYQSPDPALSGGTEIGTKVLVEEYPKVESGEFVMRGIGNPPLDTVRCVQGRSLRLRSDGPYAVLAVENDGVTVRDRYENTPTWVCGRTGTSLKIEGPEGVRVWIE